MREAPNINHLWSSLIVEELTRLGIHLFFVAPGSRSTPIVTAIAHHSQTKSVIHFDERGTAFAALGYARATGKPAVWITTSGTAVANGLPAVIEAQIDSVPLILLTADRPPELRQTGANQTIDQKELFAPYVRWKIDGPVPSTDIKPSFVLTSIDQAVHRSLSGARGPVHINWMFREPLAPDYKDSDFAPYLSEIEEWVKSSAPYTYYTGTKSTTALNDIDAVLEDICSSKKGLLVVGRLASTEEARAVSKVAQRLCWPIYADIGSHLRLGQNEKMEALLVPSFFFKQYAGDLNEQLEVVLQIGKRGVSKEVDTWIASASNARFILVDSYDDRIDPMHTVTCRVESDVQSFCSAFIQREHFNENVQSAWISRWTKFSSAAKARLSAYFKQNDELSEPSVSRIISETIGKDDGLVLGNSMPVRDMNAFGVANGNHVIVVMNRGASGIDGTLGMAAGFATGLGKRVTVLLGDLSFLHDLNSLALARHLDTPFVIVVINNDGGGIFSFLPIAGYPEIFEPYFGTPHGLTFEAIAMMFGFDYYKPESNAEFRNYYSQAINKSRPGLIEIQTTRESNREIHQRIDAFMSERSE